MPVILASASPRRLALLATLIEDFEVVVSDCDEEALTQADPVETAEILARAKAQSIALKRPESLVIGADTVVALEREQLAKPGSKGEAAAMLRKLSGREHKVITGVCLMGPGLESTFSVQTTVRFRDLTEDEIETYVATGEPMDKAGAYAIQGGAAGFVERYNGSLSNVVGLPVEALESALRTAFGLDRA